MKSSYRPPKKLRQWVNDIPGGSLYELYVSDDKTICSATGRFAHDSGSTSCSWQEFLGGKLDALVLKTMGSSTLDEAKSFVNTLL